MAKQENKAERSKSRKEIIEEAELAGKPQKKYLEGVL